DLPPDPTEGQRYVIADRPDESLTASQLSEFREALKNGPHFDHATRRTPPVEMAEMVEVWRIRTGGGTQIRTHLDPATLDTYSEARAGGATLPPVTVFYEKLDGPDDAGDDGSQIVDPDGRAFWLADGFHRLEVYRRAGEQFIPVHSRPGTRRDAILYAV